MKIQDIFDQDALNDYLKSIQDIVHMAQSSNTSNEGITKLDQAYEDFKRDYNAWYSFHAENENIENKDIEHLVSLIVSRDCKRKTLIQAITEIKTVAEVEAVINNPGIIEKEIEIDDLKGRSQANKVQRFSKPII